MRARPLKRREKTVWDIRTEEKTIKLREGAAVKRAAAFYADSEHKLQMFQFNAVYSVEPGLTCLNAGSARGLWQRRELDGSCMVAQEDDSTKMVYESTVQDIVRGAVDGYNGTVFAYGQTGSGKTHTIVGKRSDPGVLMMGMDELLQAVAKVRWFLLPWPPPHAFPSMVTRVEETSRS